MEKVIIQAEKREIIGKQVKVLRKEGKLPAVIYGHGIDPISIVLNTRDASRTMARTSSSTLVTIELEGKQYPTIVREKQLDFIRNVLIHVDFLAVSMTEKITARVGVKITGESPVVKEFGAILVNGLIEIEVECLPTDLPENFTVDISVLDVISAGIFVKDLQAPANVEILSNLEDMIVVATAAKIEEEVVEEEELIEGEEDLEGEEGEGADVDEKDKQDKGDQERK